jgi:hypothetical protein
VKSNLTLATLIAALATAPASAQQAAATLDAAAAGRFAALALACVQKEYPNKIAHVLNSPADVKAPHELTPAFYGCYDWHSSVHGHWLLARLVREFPAAPFAAAAIAALEANLTPARIAGEVAYLDGTGRESFERPYGLAWLLQLAAELRESTTPAVAALAAVVQPLEAAVVARLMAWLPKLAYPIREGELAQSAFAFGLMLDYARGTDPELAAAGRQVVEFRPTTDCPITRAVRPGFSLALPSPKPTSYVPACSRLRVAAWLTTFLPHIPTTAIRRVAADWSRDRQVGWQARASGRLEPQPGVDARGHRGGVAPRRSAPGRTDGGG